MKRLLLILPLLLALGTLQAKGKFTDYRVDGQDFEGYVQKKSSKAPTILLIHDWDGLTDYEVQRSNMLRDMGYSVFAADLFGKGQRPAEMEGRKKLTGELYADRDKMRRRIAGAVFQAKKEGLNTDNLVVLGYCFGGTAALEYARSGASARAFVPFHGGLETPKNQDYKSTKGQIMVFHGSADTNITMEHFAALAVELETTGVKHEMITYSGAPHAFSVFGSDRYREDADRKSWARLGEFLKEVTGK